MSQRPETRVLLDVDPSAKRPTPHVAPEPRLRIALLGDFSGRGGAQPPSGALIPHLVDRDEVDALMARLGPAVRVGAGDDAAALEARFRELEDFHPDRLLENVPLFRSIRELTGGGRSRAEGRGAPRVAPAPPPPVQDMISGSVLDRIVEGDEGEEEDPLRGWVDEVVRPHLVEEPAAGEREEAARVEDLLADGLRALLRDSRFRRLEALWRGVDFLVRRVETDARLGIWLVDTSREAMAADVARGQAGGASALAELLGKGAGADGDPWSVVAATWNVGPGPEDLVALRGMARLCAASGTAFVAGAEPGLAGLTTLSDADERAAWGEPDRLWEALRREPEARFVGLALPRFLLRLPYGRDGEPCDALDFEEIDGRAGPGDYLWGSPGLAVALALARAFRAAGDLDLWHALEPEVADLPLHVRTVDGRAEATPCTEVAFTENAARRLLEAGLMPLIWPRGSDGIRFLRFHSVAAPPTRLGGPWGEGG